MHFCLVWESFGCVLASKIDPIFVHLFRLDGLDFEVVIGWSQDGLQDRPKRDPGGVLGRLGVVLGRSWGLLGPLWTVLGGFWAVLRASWAALGTVLAAHEAINGSFWNATR